MPWYEKIQRVDRRIIYILMALAIIVPLLKPIGMPIAVTQPTQDAYNAIANLPAGSFVWFSIDSSASSAPEIQPAVQAMFRLCLEKKHKVILAGFWADGTTLVNDWIQPVVDEVKPKYGEDYINLGYRSPITTILEGARTDLVKTYGGTDQNNKPLSGFPIMNGLTKAKDLSLYIGFNSGSPGIDNYVANWYATGEVKNMILSCTAVEIPAQTNRYHAGILKGLVGGIAGAAEFEKLVNRPGSATSGMDAQSIGHLVIILFMVVGNIGYLAAKRAGVQK